MDAFELGKRIVRILNEEGHTAYFAGGWVRDYLLSHPSNDIDIATDCPMPKLLDLFPNALLVGMQFGVIVLPFEGHLFEIATFRKDIEYQDGRKPTRIEAATPEEDALRRDFTINGMFYDPMEGKVYDFVNGQSDLKKGVIRAIGDPYERFQEDRLRMIRAVRFNARFGYPIEEETARAIMSFAPELFPAVATERIYQEFKKMGESSRSKEAFRELFRLKLLEEIIPSLKKVHKHDFEERLNKIDETLPFALKLYFVCPDISSLYVLLEFLKAPNSDREWIELLEKTMKMIKNDHPDHEWAKFYAETGARETLKALGHLPLYEKEMKRLEFYSRMIQNNERIINSNDLRELGVLPGKKMGALLKRSFEIAVDQGLKEKKAVLEQLKKDPIWQQTQ